MYTQFKTQGFFLKIFLADIIFPESNKIVTGLITYQVAGKPAI